MRAKGLSGGRRAQTNERRCAEARELSYSPRILRRTVQRLAKQRSTRYQNAPTFDSGFLIEDDSGITIGARDTFTEIW